MLSAKLISVIIATGVSSLLILTIHRGNSKVSMEINLDSQDVVIDEDSTGWRLIQKENKLKVVSNLKFEVGSGHDKVTIHFDSRVPWSDQFTDYSSDMYKGLKSALKNYFNDLCKKLEIHSEIKITDFFVEPIEGKTQTHFDLFVECKIEPKYQVTKILQCQLIVANIVKSISVNELYSNYFFDALIQEEVVKNSNDVDSKSDHPKINVDVEQHERDMNENELQSQDEFSNPESDLVVNEVERIFDNIYWVEAYMHSDINEIDDKLLNCFKNYSEHNFAQNSFFDDNAKISISNLDAEVEYIPKSMRVIIFTFELTAENIDINEEDLKLNGWTMFDEIFKYFDINEFKEDLINTKNFITSTNLEESINYEDEEIIGAESTKSLTNITIEDEELNNNPTTYMIESDGIDSKEIESTSNEDQLEVRKSAGFGGLQMLENSSICNGRLNRKVFWTFQFILLSLTHNFFK